MRILTRPIRVAVLGSGGREHALAWKIAQSPWCSLVLAAPGNPGMRDRGGAPIARIAQSTRDLPALGLALRAEGVELVVVGTDDDLAAGVVDFLEARGFKVFGPTREAARLEWSKSFAKRVMEECGVPTARVAALEGAGFLSSAEPLSTESSGSAAHSAALATAAGQVGGYPLVVKYDGLARGKGVRVCRDESEAAGFLDELRVSGRTGQVFAEEFARGREASLFALTDGVDWVAFEPACDHKRLRDGDEGPNTGGMGAYSPAPWLPADRARTIAERVFPPVLATMRQRGTPFKGLLYAGLMIDGDRFRVLEFNARFGDPETQALLPRLESDLLPLLYGAASGSLAECATPPLRWRPGFCVNVVAASPGYPDSPLVGARVRGAGMEADAVVFFAGVREEQGALVAAGGRVLSVSAVGATLEEARSKAYARLERVGFEGMVFRRDIGGTV